MNIERPGSPSATTVAPTSKRRSTSIETRRSRLASERPPKKGVAIKNAFRSGELIAIDLIYFRSQRRQVGRARRCFSGCCGVVLADYPPRGEAAGPSHYRACVAKLAMYAHRGKADLAGASGDFRNDPERMLVVAGRCPTRDGNVRRALWF